MSQANKLYERSFNRIRSRLDSLVDPNNKLACLMIESYEWYPFCKVDDKDDPTYLGEYFQGQLKPSLLFHHVPKIDDIKMPIAMIQFEDSEPLPFLRHTSLHKFDGELRPAGPPYIRHRCFWTLGDFDLVWNHVLSLWNELGRVARLLPESWIQALGLPNIRGHNDASVWLHIVFELGLWRVDVWPLSIGCGVNTRETQSGINRKRLDHSRISDWCFSQHRDIIDASISAIDILLTEPSPKRDYSLKTEEVRKKLLSIPAGHGGAQDFHQFAVKILKNVFYPHLSNAETEQKADDGRSRIDITFDNQADSGFFYELTFRHSFKCPYILCECKNYSQDPGNPAFAQLVDRFSESIGSVGFLVCRTISDPKKILKHCKDRFKKGHLIIVLDDNDLISLAENYENSGESGVSEYLSKKLRPIMFDTTP